MKAFIQYVIDCEDPFTVLKHKKDFDIVIAMAKSMNLANRKDPLQTNEFSELLYTAPCQDIFIIPDIY